MELKHGELTSLSLTNIANSYLKNAIISKVFFKTTLIGKQFFLKK